MVLAQTQFTQMPKAFMSAELCVEDPGTLSQYPRETDSSRNAGRSALDQVLEILVACGSTARVPIGSNE